MAFSLPLTERTKGIQNRPWRTAMLLRDRSLARITRLSLEGAGSTNMMSELQGLSVETVLPLHPNKQWGKASPSLWKHRIVPKFDFSRKLLSLKCKIRTTVGPEVTMCSNSQKSKAAINTGRNLFKNPLTKSIKLIISSGLTQVQILPQKSVTALQALAGEQHRNKERPHRAPTPS